MLLGARQYWRANNNIMSTGDRRWGVRAYDYWRDYQTDIRSEYPWRQPRRSRSPRSPEPAPRSPPPPPPPAPALPAKPESSSRRQTGPDAAYLALATQPSLPDASSRKLLVLDLNGTLLLRGPRSQQRASRFGPKTPRVRSVFPRPYIPAFREYLFTPETREWLDTMVWSSAQPHSVQDMVDCVFGDDSDGLVAVWDRKSLGLSSAEYHQKTVTTKDLSKPWKFLPLGFSPAELDSTHDAELESSSTLHSALTTLLLDDSPHKAMLQPYNHVCIPEYDSTRRKLDLDSLAAMAESQSQGYGEESEVPSVTLLGAAQVDTEPFDATLLAVVGILDEIKHQSNVAGWIRAGGLWGKGGSSHATTSPSAASLLSHHGVSNQLESSSDGQPSESARRRSKKRQHAQVVATRQEQTNVAHRDTVGNDASDLVSAAALEKEPVPCSSLWFQDPPTVAYWVARGRRALDELGIANEHGLSP